MSLHCGSGTGKARKSGDLHNALSSTIQVSPNRSVNTSHQLFCPSSTQFSRSALYHVPMLLLPMGIRSPTQVVETIVGPGFSKQPFLLVNATKSHCRRCVGMYLSSKTTEAGSFSPRNSHSRHFQDLQGMLYL